MGWRAEHGLIGNVQGPTLEEVWIDGSGQQTGEG